MFNGESSTFYLLPSFAPLCEGERDEELHGRQR
jgi:hypothetical protein